MKGEPEVQRGQVLVLFALMLVALLGLAALAVDVSGYYSELRAERGVADAAALAGAADNFREGSNTVDNTEWTQARTHAMRVAISQLTAASSVDEASLPNCGQTVPYQSDVVNCQVSGTPYYVSIAAPSPTCLAQSNCDKTRSVQVTIRNPRHDVAFARLFGQSSWNAAETSIAERAKGPNYTFVTLRPADPRSQSHNPLCYPHCDANEKDIFLDGVNTKLTIAGDAGTNSNMVLTNGASVSVTDFVYRYDSYKAWSGSPDDVQISSPIPDPGYPIPAPPDPSVRPDLIFGSEPDARMDITTCETEVAKIPSAYGVAVADVATGEVACYKPGAYNFALKSPAGVTSMIFTPGVYFLNGGYMPGNNVKVIGGYDATTSGVAFVFPRSCTPGCGFDGNTADLVALNAGDAYPSGSGSRPSGAVNWDGSVVETNGHIHIPMTLIVRPDTRCLPVAPEFDDNPDCPTTGNQQLSLPGGGSLFVFGIQYSPTDNVVIAGGSGSNGYLGQIWAWTVQYTGGSNINLTAATDPEAGVLRLATPCSPGTSCVAPAATAPLP